MLDKGDVGVFQIITYCVCNTKLDWNTIEGKQKKKKIQKSMKVYHYNASSERVKYQ